MPEKQSEVDTSQQMQIADGLVIKWVNIADLHEQDLNAQVMEPRKFDTLTQNIKLRGMLESLPYCYQPNGEGVIEIISGHHRTRSAMKAGIKTIPVIVDEKPMTKSTVTAKQIAANELTGHADPTLLAQLIQQMDSADDMLMSGLDQDHLPHPESENINLNSLNVQYDFKTVELMFLGKELSEFEKFIDDSKADMVGLAPIELYDQFSQEIIKYANRHNIKNVAAAVSRLIEEAQRDEQRMAEEAQEDNQQD